MLSDYNKSVVFVEMNVALTEEVLSNRLSWLRDDKYDKSFVAVYFREYGVLPVYKVLEDCVILGDETSQINVKFDEFITSQADRIDALKKVMKEIEIEQEKPEYIAKHAEYELMCDKIKEMPMLNLTQIQACKEASRPIPQSVEKVLLFKLLITREDNIKARYIRYLLKETYYTQEELEAMTHWELQKEYLEEKECNKEDYV